MLESARDIVQCVHVSKYFLSLILYRCDVSVEKNMFAINDFEAEYFRLLYRFFKAVLYNNAIINMKYYI